MTCNSTLAVRSSISTINRLLLAFTLLSGFCPLSFAEPEPDAIHIFRLINERLEYMEMVALYKHQSHIPVEDLTREKFILEESLLSASEQGLDPDSVSVFFQSQIDAAKAIQYRYRADWLTSPPEHAETIDLTNEIRPRLTTLGKAIVASISGYLNTGQSFNSGQLTEFMDTVKVHNLSIIDKENIFRSLLQVKYYNKLPGM